MQTPHPSHRPGLETRLLRAWPWALLAGTLLPLLLAALIAWGFPSPPSLVEHKQQLLAWFTLAGATIFYWTMAFTVAAGCWVVRVMKGPMREADGYSLPEPDRFAA